MKGNTLVLLSIAALIALSMAVGAQAQNIERLDFSVGVVASGVNPSWGPAGCGTAGYGTAGYASVESRVRARPTHCFYTPRPHCPKPRPYYASGCDDGWNRPRLKPRPRPVTVCASQTLYPVAYCPPAVHTVTQTASYTYPVYWGRPPATVEVSTWNDALFGYPCATVVSVATQGR